MDRMAGAEGPQDNELSLRPMASLFIITKALKTLLDEMIKAGALLPECAGYGFIEGDEIPTALSAMDDDLLDEEWEEDDEL